MGAPVGQTPGPWVLAGGAGVFSAACIAALAKAGLEPDDFGSYSHTRDKIRAAKRRVMEAQIAKRNGQPAEVSAHDKLLAQSNTGHLQQNALFQQTRGDACRNEQPGAGGPGAPCYDFGGAPCGPHPSGSGKKKVGTTHWAVGANEASVRTDPEGQPRKPGDPVPAGECQDVSKETARLTAKGADPESVTGHDRRRRNSEAEARAASAADVQAKQAKEAKGVDADSKGGKAAVEGETAEECIDNFTKLGTEQMRRQVMQDYGDPESLKAKKAQLAAEQKAAEDRVEEQEKRREQAVKDKDWDEVQRASQEGAWARQDAKESKAAHDSADCMAAQVPILQAQMAANGGAMPAMSGSVPGFGGVGRVAGGNEGADKAEV